MDFNKIFGTYRQQPSDSKAKRIWYFCRLVKIYFKLSKEQKTKNGH